jgi:hypothetical protein
MSNQYIGNMIDAMDVQLDIGENQHLTEVFIVGKVLDLATGQAYLVLGSNKLDWIAEGGLLQAATLARGATVVRMINSNGQCADPNCTEDHEGE